MGANERSLAQYMNTQYGKPNFFDTDHTTGYVSFLKNQPKQNVSPRVIGEAISKQLQPVRRSVQNSKRETETFEYSPMFEAEEVVDPLLNAKVIKAEKPNIPEIQKALVGNPAMLEAAESWIKSEAADYMNADKTLTADIAQEKALGEFWSQATRGLSRTAYDYNVPPLVRPSGAGKKPPVEVEQGPVDISFTYVPNYTMKFSPKAGNVSKPYINWTPEEKEALTQQGQLNLGLGDTYYFEKPQTAGSNKQVILLSNNKNAIDEELVEKSKRGGYMLKTGFAYNATTPVTVRVFKEDTNFPLTGETKYTYDKYTPVTDDTYEKMTPEQRDKYIINVKGHLISPMGGVPEETSAGVPKYSPSKVSSTQVVVLDESAEDIRSAMTRANKKVKTKKKPFTFTKN